MTTDLTRREALKRLSAALGGTLSASTIAAALSPAAARAWSTSEPWAPSTLSPSELETVATIADYIIPTTDTPGARAAGVHRYIDALLSDHYPASVRDPFLSGLRQLDVAAQSRHGGVFLRCATSDQLALLEYLDAQAYLGRGAAARDASVSDAAGFFRRMKDLTVTGYYTSEIGATKELRVMPMGSYRDIPYADVGHTWA